MDYWNYLSIFIHSYVLLFVNSFTHSLSPSKLVSIHLSVHASLFPPFCSILYQQSHQPFTCEEKTNLDNVLLTTLQVLSGVVLQNIESIDLKLRRDNPAMFEE